MELQPGMSIHPPGLFLEKTKTLIIADLHLGAEEALVKEGLFLPRTQKERLLTALRGLLQHLRPARVVIAGDLKHAFGTILDEEWRDALELIDLIATHGAHLEVVLGNHDKLLAPVLQKRNINAHETLLVGKTLITHGDKEPAKKRLDAADTLIIGHEHPSILLHDGVRKERYKCYLKGRYKGKTLIVLPSAYPLIEGVDVLASEPIGPILRRAKSLEAYVIEGEDVLPFGLLERLNSNI